MREGQASIPPGIAALNAVHYKWVILGVLTLAHLVTSNSALSIQPLAPFLQRDLNLRHVHIGLMTSAFYLGALILSVPLGWFVDRFGVLWALVGSQLVVGIFILAVSCVHSFGMILFFLVFGGIGYSGINPSSGKAIMCWFPWKGRATAMSIKQTGIPLGGALAAATLPALAQALSWRTAFVATGVVTVASGILTFFLYKEPRGDGSRREPATFLYKDWRRMLEIFRNRDLILLNVLVVAYIALQMVLMTYLLLFFRDVLGRSVLVAGVYLSVAHVGGVVGRLTWGLLSDYALAGRRRPVLMLNGGVSALLCFACAFLSPGHPSWLLFLFVFVFGFSAIGWNGLYLTYIGELSGKEQAGAAMGASLTIIYVGVLIGPPLFGFSIDRTGSYAVSWMIAAAVMAVATVLIPLVKENKG